MVLRYFIHRLVHNEHLIQRLSESAPIRRAAQLTAYLLLRGKVATEQSLEKLPAAQLYGVFAKTLSEMKGRLGSTTSHNTPSNTFSPVSKGESDVARRLRETIEEMKRRQEQNR